jgi:type IV pilus assembly protein PilQ
VAEIAPQSSTANPNATKADSQASSLISSAHSKLQLTNFAGVNQIKIPVGAAVPKYSVTRLSNPERVVVDFESASLLSAQTIKAKGLEYVSAVRIGTHPERTRLVVDLKNGQHISHSARIDGGALILDISATKQETSAKKEASAKQESQAAQRVANAELAPKKLPIVAESKEGNSPAQSHRVGLALDEESVVSGSSTDATKSAQQSAPQQVMPEKVAAVKPPTQQAAPATADRAQIAPAALEPKQQPSVKADAVAGSAAVDASTQEVKDTSSAKPVSTPTPAVVTDTQQRTEHQQQDKSKTAKVSAVHLDGNGKSSPAVVIKVEPAVEHTITRTAPSEYVVTLRNATAAPAVLHQTLFASSESGGIRSVRAVTEGANTLVRIFTQPSSYLTVRRVGDALRIEETQDLAQIARDIRAQIAPAAVKQAEAGKEATSKDSGKQAADRESKQGLGGANKPASDRVVEESANPNDGELAAIKGSSSAYTGRLISLDLQDADIDSALRIIAEVSNLNIVAGDGVVGKVTLKLVDVPWDQALEVILKSQGLDKVLEGNVLRVAPVDKLRTERESFKQARVAEEELEPLSVKYIRVSYAKAAEIKGLVETVLSERGIVAFDERSNQLVVKDTRKGLQNVIELIKKIDLRTPQILLETQIIEASRNLTRQLGAELGLQYIQSPATGNGTGLNFPSAISVGGSADARNPNSIVGSAFPIPTDGLLGSAVTMLFDSADGTKSLALRLSQLEQEGEVRIISKPAVATTNNKAAEIKSVEKFRVKLPNGGLSIASGSGATSSGSGDVATQTIEAGIVLNVTPQASPDYYILLDIKAKSSTFGAEEVDGIPNEFERSASSSVLVSSGQTFALGGIYKISERDRVAGIPFLKDIPVIGTLFRSNQTDQADEELLFFITPRIVEGSFEDASAKVIS